MNIKDIDGNHFASGTRITIESGPTDYVISEESPGVIQIRTPAGALRIDVRNDRTIELMARSG